MKIKSILGLGLCVGAIALTTTSCGNSDDKIYIATNAEFAPFEYKEGSNFLGIDMDIMKGYAEYNNKKYEIKDMDFDSVLPSVSQGKCDIAAAALTVNATRLESVDFSNTYYTANQVIIVKANSSYTTLTTKEAVEAEFGAKGAKLGCQRGTTGEYYIEGSADWDFSGIKDTTCATYDNAGLACKDLSNGKLEGVIVDKAPAQLLVEKFSDLVVLDYVLTEEEYAFAVKKGNKELVDSINEYIEYAKNNGTFDEIISKYYAE